MDRPDHPQPWADSSFEETEAGLGELAKLAAGLGVAAASNRIDRLVRCMHDLVAAQKASQTQEFAANRGHRRLLWNLTEAHELSSLMPCLGQLPGDYVREKLRHVFSGPEDLSSESQRSNIARNITFELSIASRLAANGVPLVVRPLVDVAAVFDGHLVLFQCKRPYVASKFKACVKDAFRQLKRDIADCDAPCWGVIAVSAGRVVNPSHSILLKDRKAGPDLLAESLDRLVAEHRSLWGALNHPAILGAVVDAWAPAYFSREKQPIAALHRGTTAPLHAQGSVQTLLLMRVVSGLARGGWFKVS